MVLRNVNTLASIIISDEKKPIQAIVFISYDQQQNQVEK